MENNSKNFCLRRDIRTTNRNQTCTGLSADQTTETSSFPDQSEPYYNKRHISNLARNFRCGPSLTKGTSASLRIHRVQYGLPFDLSQCHPDTPIIARTNSVSTLALRTLSPSQSQTTCQAPASFSGARRSLASFPCSLSQRQPLLEPLSSTESLLNDNQNIISNQKKTTLKELLIPSKHSAQEIFSSCQSIRKKIKTTNSTFLSKGKHGASKLTIMHPNDYETLDFQKPTHYRYQLHAYSRKNTSAPKFEAIVRTEKAAHTSPYQAALIPTSWIQKAMSLRQVSRFRASSFATGSAIDKLSFKILYQIILSPVFGISESTLAVISDVLTTLPHFVTSPETVVISGKNLPPELEDLLRNALSGLFANYALESLTDHSNCKRYQHDKLRKSASGYHSTNCESDEKQFNSLLSANQSMFLKHIDFMKDAEDRTESAFCLLADNIRYCFESVFVKQANFCSGRNQHSFQILRGYPFVPQHVGMLPYKTGHFETADYICADPLYKRIMRWIHPDYVDPFRSASH